MTTSAVPGDHHTTTTKLLAEAASVDLGDYLPGPWAQEYIEGDSEEPAYYRVTTPDGTVVATLPDWAGQVALFLAVARDAMPALLAERSELLILAERLRAELAEEERACAERGKYLAEVDAALIAAGQDEAGGYIAYPRRVQQLAGEAQFWHFEYREAMDNYKGEAAALRDARAELARLAGNRDNAEAAIAAWEQGHSTGYDALLRVKAALATPAVCTCGAALVHQHGCQAGQ